MVDRLITLFCLLITGTLLALSTIFAKLAVSAGLTPEALLSWSCLGAAITLMGNAAFRGHLPVLNLKTVKYIIVAAFISFAAPNSLFFTAIPYVGVSFVALAITFPPLLTYLGALFLRLEPFDFLRAAGVLLALCGASYIAWLKLSAPIDAGAWPLFVLAGPVLLAAGNLYRTRRWPEGAHPNGLAATMLVASAAMLLMVGSLPDFSLAVPPTRHAAFLIAAQIVTFSAQFSLFFVLQKRAGPVYISLLGPVGATVGVPFAVLLLGEPLPAGLMLGGLLIALGIALVSQIGRSKKVRASVPQRIQAAE